MFFSEPLNEIIQLWGADKAFFGSGLTHQPTCVNQPQLIVRLPLSLHNRNIHRISHILICLERELKEDHGKKNQQSTTSGPGRGWVRKGGKTLIWGIPALAMEYLFTLSSFNRWQLLFIFDGLCKNSEIRRTMRLKRATSETRFGRKIGGGRRIRGPTDCKSCPKSSLRRASNKFFPGLLTRQI